jgi:hypothetical protein
MLKEGDVFPSELLTYDVRIPIGSLPRMLRTGLDRFPDRESYLIPDIRKVDTWKGRFKALGEGMNIGISWRGGKALSVRRERSIELVKWEKVLSLAGVHYINLQYGNCADELMEIQNTSGIVIHDWKEADPLKDLDDFAAQIAALDLVISVDNSTVHMAGALGVPVWTLLPFDCDWRWMQHCEDSPWYKTMRLFRQRVPGDWGNVIDDFLPLLRSCRDSGIVPKADDEHSYKKERQSETIELQMDMRPSHHLQSEGYPNTKIAILLTTFLRDDLMYKTLETIVKYWQELFIVLIADQGCKSDADIKMKEERLQVLFGNQKMFQYIKLPFDCGLSAARNALVTIAKDMNMPYCLLTADSIQFAEKYDFDPILSFLSQDSARGMVGFYLYGGNRTAWQRDLELVEGEYFYLKIPRRDPIEHHGILFQPVDICDNFFLAKTDCLMNNLWDETLKLSEHEDFFWRLKNNPVHYEVFWSYDIQARYTHEKRQDYLKMRNRIYNEFRAILQKKYGIKEWIKYEE